MLYVILEAFYAVLFVSKTITLLTLLKQGYGVVRPGVFFAIVPRVVLVEHVNTLRFLAISFLVSRTLCS